MARLRVNLRAKARGRGTVLLPWVLLGISQSAWQYKTRDERQRLLAKIRAEG